MSDTPRADAAIREVYMECELGDTGPLERIAKQLERELAAAHVALAESTRIANEEMDRRSLPEDANMPPAVKIAMRILLNHVEPGWENCQLVVQSWMDEAVPAGAVERVPQQQEGK